MTDATKQPHVAGVDSDTPLTDALMDRLDAMKASDVSGSVLLIAHAHRLEKELGAANRRLSDAVTSERARCEACVPNTWLDPLLTGPNAVVGEPPYHAPDIEKLFIAVRKRMEAPK